MADNSVRWYLDLGFAGVRLVGKVWQTPPVGESPKGGVRPPSPWCAVGMAAAWGDTDLGQTHATRNDAMRAVVEWWATRAVEPSSIDPARLNPPVADWVTKAIAGLRLAQWAGPYKGHVTCPVCEGTVTAGHAETCALWAALKMVPPQ